MKLVHNIKFSLPSLFLCNWKIERYVNDMKGSNIETIMLIENSNLQRIVKEKYLSEA